MTVKQNYDVKSQNEYRPNSPIDITTTFDDIEKKFKSDSTKISLKNLPIPKLFVENMRKNRLNKNDFCIVNMIWFQYYD